MIKNSIVTLFSLMMALFFCTVQTIAAEAELGQEQVVENEALIVKQMIEAIKSISHQRYPNGIIKRFNQAKSLACLDAEFHVSDNLPDNLRHGLFASPGHYSSKVRFAKASNEDDRKKDFYGLSIKVSGVQGESLWGEDGVQDFVFNSYPALFASDPQQFLDFINATEEDSRWKFFINPKNWGDLLIIFKGREQISSPLDINYWSTTPSRLGLDQKTAIKYSVQPCENSIPEKIPDDATADYLTAAVKNQLQQAPVCFDLMLQPQTNAESMPVEDASVVWPVDESPFHKVAQVIIKNQAFMTAEAKSDCEEMTFNPWQSLLEHKPIGGINRVRQAVYSEISRYRNLRNQIRSDR